MIFKKFIRFLAIAGLVVGSGLSLLNLIGMYYLPDRHPDTVNTKRTKADIELRQPDEVLSELDGMPQVSSVQDMVRLTKIFSSGVMHYWPEPDEYDEYVLYGWQENWALAFAGRIELFFLSKGGARQPKIVRFERADYEDIVSKGVGFCSQVAQAVVDYLGEQGISAYVLNLEGHVVAVVGPLIDQQEYIVDADYGVLLPFGRKEAEGHPELIRKAYQDTGYSVDLSNMLAERYGPAGNTKYVMSRWEWLFKPVKWGVPIAMCVLGVGLLYRFRRC